MIKIVLTEKKSSNKTKINNKKGKFFRLPGKCEVYVIELCKILQ